MRGAPIVLGGKSKSRPHNRGGSADHVIPIVAIDYMFLRDGEHIHDGISMLVLVARDIHRGTCGAGMVFARIVPQKGVDAYAAKSLASDIAMLGYNEVVLKSDNEPSIMALKAAVKAERIERIIMEQSLVEDSRANGSIENTIQQVQGQFRALKDGLESVSYTHLTLPTILRV